MLAGAPSQQERVPTTLQLSAPQSSFHCRISGRDACGRSPGDTTARTAGSGGKAWCRRSEPDGVGIDRMEHAWWAWRGLSLSGQNTCTGGLLEVLVVIVVIVVLVVLVVLVHVEAR